MGMRITNNIMNSNAKINIMLNKGNADKMNTTVATGQKIARPSDDPVIAIRNLRLNSNIDQLNQFKSKNIPDAESWLQTTGTALDGAYQALQDIHNNLTTGASDDKNNMDRDAIAKNLREMKAEFYSLGNADYAGRTVFTGYRTGESLTCLEEEDDRRYTIVENFEASDVGKRSYVAGSFDVYTTTGGEQKLNSTVSEENIIEREVYRVRLAYDELEYPQMTFSDENGTASDSTVVINYTPKGASSPSTLNVTVKSLTGDPTEDDKLYIDANDEEKKDTVYLIADTGELILGKNAAAKLYADGTTFNIEYSKTEFEKGDLRPEHYFACKSFKTGDNSVISYNYDDNGDPDFKDQKIKYEVAFNQTLEINSNASEVFSHDIGRDIDDLVEICESVSEIEEKMEEIKSAAIAENLWPDGDDENISQLTIDNYPPAYRAAYKELSYKQDIMQSMYAAAMTKFDKYMDAVNLENSKVGSKEQRLELTKERVTEQLSNFKELSDENINVDLTESAIDLKSAQLALEAAQAATAKIAEQSLLNYL